MLREFPEIRTQKLIKCHICSSLDTHQNYHILIHQPVNQNNQNKIKILFQSHKTIMESISFYVDLRYVQVCKGSSYFRWSKQH